VQPLTVRMDPRSSASVPVLNEQFWLAKKIFEETLKSRGALAEINSVQSELAELKPELVAQHPAVSLQVIDLEALMQHILEGAREEAPDIDGLASANGGLDTVLNAVEGGNREVPAQILTLHRQSSQEAEKQIAVWAEVKKTKLTTLNIALQQAGLAPVSISEIEEEVEDLKTR
jgi:hypothetical protein